MRIRIFALILTILIAGGLFAQESDSWYMDKPIVDVQFDGLKHVSESELAPIVEPFLDQKYNRALFMDLQSKLYALNYFSLIEAEAVPRTAQREELVLLFHVRERPIIDQIKIEGNRNVRNSEILDTILLKRDDILTKNKLNVDENAIRDLYLEKGFSSITVTSETEENKEENTVQVIFKIEEGFQTRIRTIGFSGNNFAPDGTLK